MEIKMKYNVTISAKETENGSFVFVAKYPSLKGVSGTGATQVEALQDLEENAEAHIEFMKMDGEEPPTSDFDIQALCKGSVSRDGDETNI